MINTRIMLGAIIGVIVVVLIVIEGFMVSKSLKNVDVDDIAQKIFGVKVQQV